ncbi:17661_t:CDS:2, partial [Rhizophagus irregularis]
IPWGTALELGTALKTLVNRILYKCKILCVLHRDSYDRIACLYLPFFFITFSSLSSLSLDLLSDEERPLDNEQAT